MPRKGQFNREEHFWTKAQENFITGCWEWLGGKLQSGYGAATWRGKSFRAHRLAYTFIHGNISNQDVICHICDNKLCINPDHLISGSQLDNVQDCISKGRRRYLYGENHQNAKLSKNDVLKIRSLFSGGIPQFIIAKQFGLSRQAINDIVHRKRWKWLDQA